MIVATPVPQAPPEEVRYKNPITIRGLADLCNLDPPTWQINGYVPNGGLVTLFGDPGAGKSFLALDWGLSIACGEDWHGREVEQGAVLYLVCEGIAGMPNRVQAWLMERGLDIPPDRLNEVPFYYTTGFNDLRGPAATTDLLRALEHDLAERGTKLALVVLDTLSRTLGGADENSAGEMNMALDQLGRVREATGAAVIILHHTAKGKTYERGSTVLRGACDTMLYLQDNDDYKLLMVDKQRDWEASEPLQLWLKQSGDSAVFTPRAHGTLSLTQREKRTLGVLREAFDGTPMSYSAITKLADESETTLRRTLKRLVQVKALAKEDGKRGGYYFPNEETDHERD